MSYAVQQRIQSRLNRYDDWDEGDGFILAEEVGARMSSYTGPHGWESNAGHEPPPIQPLLKRVFAEIEEMLEGAAKKPGSETQERIGRAARQFHSAPTLASLVAYADAVQEVCEVSWPESGDDEEDGEDGEDEQYDEDDGYGN